MWFLLTYYKVFLLFLHLEILYVTNVSWKSESCSVVSYSLRTHGLYKSPWNSPGQNTGVGSLSLLQGIFSTQESNPGLPHCRRIVYQLNCKGSQRILEWVAYPFSSRSSQPRNWTGISYIEGIFLPTELSGKPIICFRPKILQIHVILWKPSRGLIIANLASRKKVIMTSL